MEVLMSLQGSQMETDDPITSYMLQVFFYNYFVAFTMSTFYLFPCFDFLIFVIGMG